MKKIIVLTLTVLIALTSLFGVACKNKTIETSRPTTLFSGGIHIFDRTLTEDYLVQNGKTDYKILVEEDHSETIYTAINELKELFYQATGIILPVVYDNQVYFDENSTFISLGNNKIAKELELLDRCNYDLEVQGYAIKTFKKSIFILGNSDRAALYGVYGFLELEFNFDCLNHFTTYIDEGITDRRLSKYDVVDVPDFSVRNSSESYINNSSKVYNRYRMEPRGLNVYAGELSVHSYFTWVPPEIYNNPDDQENYHPEWFGPDVTQLCLSAHGDTESRVKLMDVVFECLQEAFMANSEPYIFLFSHMDNGNWCSCESCTASKKKYNGSAGAIVVQFCNELAQKTREWFASPEGEAYKREFYIAFLAYQHTEIPPTKYDEATKKHIPIDETVICDPNVSPIVALGSYDYQNSIEHEINRAFVANLDGWASVSQVVSVYKYKCNWRYFLLPYDIFSYSQEFYQYAASTGAKFIYDEGQQTNPGGGATGWQILKGYLTGKLSWDTNVDLEMLTARYFDKCFGPGAESMMKWFKEYRVHSLELIENQGFTRTNSMYHTILQEKYWPKQLIDRWCGYVEDALEEIDYLKKVDPAQYTIYYDNIALERISLYYMIYGLYAKGNRYSQAYINEVTETLVADCKKYGLGFSFS